MFKITTNGTGFTTLHSFASGSGSSYFITNSDGSVPDLIRLSGNTWFGKTDFGGSGGGGTLFKININGTGFTTLHSFASGSGSYPFVTNSEGAWPQTFVVSGNTLYGATFSGGQNGNGTLFAVNTNGSGYKILHLFAASAGSNPNIFNSDGIGPEFIILSSNTLYGATYGGGSGGNGTLFEINTNGTGFTTLHSFASGSLPYNGVTNSDGANPNTLTLTNNTLYGTTYTGGNAGNGTLFSLSLAPGSATGSLQVNLAPAGAANAGAQWQVDSSTWQANGTTVSGLSVGSHTIAFSPISGWITPTNQTAIIIANHTTVATGTYLNVDPALLPAITAQPEDTPTWAGYEEGAVICVTASGAGPLHYQWRKNSMPIPSATNTCLVFAVPQITDSGNYDVIVTNNYGSVTSRSAAFTVTNAPPIISWQLQAQNVSIGSNATLVAWAYGTLPIHYQWRFNLVNILGAEFTDYFTGQDTSYTITNAQPVNAGYYTVVITNIAGSVTSTPALLTVVPSGQSNSVLWLNGTSGYVSIPSSSDLQNPTNITVETWLYPNPPQSNINGNNGWFIVKSDGQNATSQRSYEINLSNTGNGEGIFANLFFSDGTWS